MSEGMRPAERALIVRYAAGHIWLEREAIAIHQRTLGAPGAHGAAHAAFMAGIVKGIAAKAGPCARPMRARKALLEGAPTPMAGARLERASDWPPAMREASDAMEAASDDVLNAMADESDGTIAAFQAARKRFAAEALALDKARRPEFYEERP